LPDNPCDWLEAKNWGEICRLSNVAGFTDFYKLFSDPKISQQFFEIYSSSEPHKVPLPEDIRASYN